MSTSHFMMDWKVVSWMPLASLPHEAGLEEHFGAPKALRAHRDDVAVRQLVGLLLIKF